MENKEKLFQVPAIIQGIQTLKDRTLKITAYISREIPGEEKTKIFDLEQQEGWLLFKENSFQPKDVPKENAKVDVSRKSLSERLYNVLFVYHNHYISNCDFETWRRQEMEKIINDYKNKLR